MSKIACVFPGQGSQAVGMGRDLGEASQRWDEANAALGFDLRHLCFEGPEAELILTANTQPAILTASIVALDALAAAGVSSDLVAGHSLGEYSALVAAGAIGFADAVRTVRARGQFMQEAVPPGEGAMAAILGLDRGLMTVGASSGAGSRARRPRDMRMDPGKFERAFGTRAPTIESQMNLAVVEYCHEPT